MTSDAPTPLPTPPDFPVEWPEPGDEQGFWIQDRMHLPYAIAPLDATMVQAAFSEGASRAIARLSMPIAGLRVRVHNGYTYLGPEPVHGTPEEMEQRFGEMQRLTGELGATVLQDWRESFEPRVEEMAAEVLAFDASSASTEELATFAASMYDRLVEAWDIHMRVNIPPMNAVFGFEDFLEHALGTEAMQRSRELLQGFDNKSVEMGGAIWALSRWVAEDQSFADLVAGADSVDAVLGSGHARAEEFAQRWQDFLDRYGWRSDRFLEAAHPSWREEQQTPFAQLQGFLAKPEADDPYAEHRRKAAEREALTAQLRGELPDSEEARGTFDFLLSLAQQYIPIAEDHNFTIDQRFTMVVRSGVQQLGARLVEEGRTDEVDDVFYLTLEEIRSLAGSEDLGDLRPRVAERRAAQREQEAMTPPPALGTPPPPDIPPDPLVTKFFGLGAPPSVEDRVIKGAACSSGVYEGVAKVVLTLGEAVKLQQGEIMVCPMTMPAWTPLFGIAGAIVADAGGPLSHCAIVAREYGIPCVAGTQVATSVIQDGQRIRVDGSAGTVEILG
jgi:phosphohistidine swiveling domain-containing protein